MQVIRVPIDRPNVQPRILALATMLVIIPFTVSIYRTEISPFNEYMGLTYGFSWNITTATCFMLALVPLCWIPCEVRRPSQMMLWFLYLMVVMPSCVAPVMTGKFDSGILLKTASIAVAAFALLCGLLSVPPARFSRLRMTEQGYIRLLVICFLAMLIGCMVYFGLPSRLPTLTEIYGIREEFGHEAGAHGRLIGYLVQWFGKVLTALMLVNGIVRRIPLLVLLAVCGQIYVFALVGEKVLFFSLFFVALIVFLLHRSSISFGMKILGGTLAVMLAGKAHAVMSGSGVVLYMTIRRVLITPGINTACYIEYFSYFADKVYYAHSFLGRLLPIDSPYGFDYSPARMVGMAYRSYADMFVINLNVNLWGEGFADWGVIGVVIATFILAFLLWFYDSVSRHLPVYVSGGVLAASVLGVVDGSLYTQIFTNGMLFMVLMVFLMPPLRQECRNLQTGARDT